LLRIKDIQARENDTIEKIRQAANIVKAAAKLSAADISQNWGVDITLGGEQTEEHDELAEGEAAFSSIPRTANKLAVIAIQEKLADREVVSVSSVF
jgi:hypothetical protein